MLEGGKTQFLPTLCSVRSRFNESEATPAIYVNHVDGVLLVPV